MNLGQMTIGGSPMGASGRIGRAPGNPPGPHAVTGTAKGPSGPMVFAYDNNGNMSSKEDMTLTWDYKDRLSSLNHGTKTAQYVYDYGDTRKKKNVVDVASGLHKEVLYIDKFSEIREGNLIKYVYDKGNSRVARTDTGSFPPSAILPSSFYLHDHLGSANLTLNVEGTVTEQFVNFPYGEPRIEIHASSYLSATDYKFTGKERDEESGLQYFGARYYTDYLGRFTSVDPLYADADALAKDKRLNLYGYASNNPTNRVDYLGLADYSVTKYLDEAMARYGLSLDMPAEATPVHKGDIVGIDWKYGARSPAEPAEPLVLEGKQTYPKPGPEVKLGYYKGFGGEIGVSPQTLRIRIGIGSSKGSVLEISPPPEDVTSFRMFWDIKVKSGMLGMGAQGVSGWSLRGGEWKDIDSNSGSIALRLPYRVEDMTGRLMSGWLEGGGAGKAGLELVLSLRDMTRWNQMAENLVTYGRKRP